METVTVVICHGLMTGGIFTRIFTVARASTDLMKALLSVLFVPILLFAEELHVHVGTNDFLLAFADTALSLDVRMTIADDLAHEYAMLTNKPVVLHETDSHGRIKFQSYGISPYENGIRLPSVYSIDPADGIRRLEVDEHLSCRYVAAMDFRNANTNAILQGLSFVESLRNGLVSSMAPDDVSRIFHCSGLSAEELKASREELSHFLDDLTLLDLGLLSVFETSEMFPDQYNTFVMAIPCIDHGNDDSMDVVVALWIENKWKLLLER